MFNDCGNVGDEGIGEVSGLTMSENAWNRGTVQLISKLDTGGR